MRRRQLYLVALIGIVTIFGCMTTKVSFEPVFELEPGYYEVYIGYNAGSPPSGEPDAYLQASDGRYAEGYDFAVDEQWWAKEDFNITNFSGVRYKWIAALPTIDPAKYLHAFTLTKSVTVVYDQHPKCIPPKKQPDGVRLYELFPGDYQVFYNTANPNPPEAFVRVPALEDDGGNVMVTKCWFVEPGFSPQTFKGIDYAMKGSFGDHPVPSGLTKKYEVTETLKVVDK